MPVAFKVSRLVPSTALLFGALVGLALGCSTRPEGSGRLAVALTDAPAPAVKEIVVTIDKVTAHSEQEGWVTVASGVGTLDLLQLKDKSVALGFANLPAGKVTQVRLYLAAEGDRYVTLQDGSRQELTVPSGLQSGIKVNGPFTLSSCETTSVLLDFDGEKSLKVHPTGTGRWILRPVIRVKETSAEPTGCNDGSPDAGPVTPPPTPGGAGDACSADTECLSGVCLEGVCAPGGPGAPCAEPADCVSGTCNPDGTCGNGPAGGTGSSCNAPTDCLSGSCTNNVCDPGNQGTPCESTSDCSDGYSCQQNTCVPVIG
jgi:Domain of unknown function (DUF4382)